MGGSGESSSDGGGDGTTPDETCLYLCKCRAIDAVVVVNVGCHLLRHGLMMAGDEECGVVIYPADGRRML